MPKPASKRATLPTKWRNDLAACLDRAKAIPLRGKTMDSFESTIGGVMRHISRADKSRMFWLHAYFITIQVGVVKATLKILQRSH